MRRREFITLLGGIATSFPFAARAQQPDQLRRIGILMNRASESPDGQARVAAFKQRLEQLGWIGGSNVRIDVCWGADDLDRERQCATDLVALAPNALFARLLPGTNNSSYKRAAATNDPWETIS